jgi:hypothetical protein
MRAPSWLSQGGVLVADGAEGLQQRGDVQDRRLGVQACDQLDADGQAVAGGAEPLDRAGSPVRLNGTVVELTWKGPTVWPLRVNCPSPCSCAGIVVTRSSSASWCWKYSAKLSRSRSRPCSASM